LKLFLMGIPPDSALRVVEAVQIGFSYPPCA
jgi:hypothetical protein